MLCQFFWCQRVSVWLRGMCLHSNIWGLIINIKKYFLQRIKHADKMVITKLAGFCHKNTVAKKKCEVFWPRRREPFRTFNVAFFFIIISTFIFKLRNPFTFSYRCLANSFPYSNSNKPTSEKHMGLQLSGSLNRQSQLVSHHLLYTTWHRNRNYNSIFNNWCLLIVVVGSLFERGDLILSSFSSPLPTSISQEWMETKGERRSTSLEEASARCVLVASAKVTAYMGTFSVLNGIKDLQLFITK